jgi:CheY-like chemotaxis protein
MAKDCLVMVIEDDEDTREALVELLRAEGYTTEGAADGRNALEVLHKGLFKPDVIVLDLYMPTMGGREFKAALKNLPDFAHIPVIFVTGSSPLTSTPDAFETLQKPMDVNELLEVVRRGCQVTPRHQRPMTA